MKNNKWLNIFVGVISPIFSICGVTLFNIPVEILRVFTFLWLVYIYECFKDLYKLKKKRAKRSKKLKALSKEISELNNTDNSKKKVKEEKEKEYQNRKNYYRKLDEKHEKIKRNIIKVSILFAVFYIPRSDPIISFGQQAINVIIAPFLETEEMDKPFDLTDMESAEEKDSAKNSEDIKSPIEPEDSTEMTGTADSEGHVNRVDFTDSEKNTLVKLDLEFPDGYPGIDNEIKELYNLLFYPGEENVNEIMLSNVTAWIGSCKSNTPLDNAVTDNGESAQYFSGIEAEFSDMNIVLSDLLDIVIDGREELFESYPNGTLSWLLSNNYQTYALNYYEKTKNADSVLYFYMKSISCAQKSLNFNMDDKDKIINYIKFRFKDIGDCKILDENIRLRAYEIYNALDYALGRYYSNDAGKKTVL